MNKLLLSGGFQQGIDYEKESGIKLKEERSPFWLYPEKFNFKISEKNKEKITELVAVEKEQIYHYGILFGKFKINALNVWKITFYFVFILDVCEISLEDLL